MSPHLHYRIPKDLGKGRLFGDETAKRQSLAGRAIRLHSWNCAVPIAALSEQGMRATGNYDYVVFQHLTGTTFTLTATPLSSTSGSVRAPVNGIQIVSTSGS